MRGQDAGGIERPENFKIWKDDNHAIGLTNIDVLQKVNYIHENNLNYKK